MNIPGICTPQANIVSIMNILRQKCKGSWPLTPGQIGNPEYLGGYLQTIDNNCSKYEHDLPKA